MTEEIVEIPSPFDRLNIFHPMIASLILLFSLLFTILALRNFAFTVKLTIFLLPAYLVRFDIFGTPYTMLEVMIWILFLVYLYRLFKAHRLHGWQERLKHPSREFLSLRIAILLFFVSASIALIISPNPIIAPDIWRTYFLQPILLFFILVDTFKEKKEVEDILIALGLSVLVIFVFGIGQYFTAWKLNPIYMIDGKVDRITSIFGFPNAIGLFVAPILALYLGWSYDTWNTQKAKHPSSHIETRSLRAEGKGSLFDSMQSLLLRPSALSIFQGTVFVAGIIALFLAKSEGAIVAIFAATLFTGIVIKEYRIPALAVCVVVALGLVFSPMSRALILSKITFSGWSEQVRLTMWKETWELIKDHPVAGVGLSGYPIAFVKYHKAWYIEIFQYPHNILFNFWVELGLLGVLAFAWLLVEYVGLAFKALKTHRGMAVGLLAAIFAILVHGLVDVPYFKSDLAALFWIFMASAVILYRCSSLAYSKTSSME